jgi:hypothetical protein
MQIRNSWTRTSLPFNRRSSNPRGDQNGLKEVGCWFTPGKWIRIGCPADSGITDRNLVKRATLSNGLRVVIIQDSLAPVVTVEMNVLAGGNESPPEYPGMAHAQEHMPFVAAQK